MGGFVLADFQKGWNGGLKVSSFFRCSRYIEFGKPFLREFVGNGLSSLRKGGEEFFPLGWGG